MTPDPPNHTLSVLLGFAFVAVWAGMGLGEALLCLLGAAVFRLAAGLLAGDIDVEDLRERLDAARAPRGQRLG